jgi:hypothetical protein
MVMCWGAGIDDVPGGSSLHDGVLVVVGRQSHQALAKLDARHLDPFTIDCAAELVETFVQLRDGYHRRRAHRRPAHASRS